MTKPVKLDTRNAKVPRQKVEQRCMSDYEEMLDAQKGCVPCKLCGGAR
jgi:hypothetical protein